MISVSPVWLWIVSYEKYSIRGGISLCTVVKANRPVLRDHDRGFCEHTPYPGKVS